jgi:hypothetical protein
LGAGGVDQRSHGLLEVTGFFGERLDALRERLEGGLVPNASRSPSGSGRRRAHRSTSSDRVSSRS